MIEQPSAARYNRTAIILHWLIAALLVFVVVLGLRMEDASGQAKFAIFQLHKSVGITILLLIALRLLWRMMRRPPAITARGWERALAKIVHGAFYVLLFAMPISGWAIVSTSEIVVPTLLYGLIPWPDLPMLGHLAEAVRHSWHGASEFVHVNLVNVLYGLFALHVLGALKHHFLDRDAELDRMLPGTVPGKASDPRLIAVFAGTLLIAGLGFWWLPFGPGANASLVSTAPAPAPTRNDTASALPPDAPVVVETEEAELAPQTTETPAAEPTNMPLSNWAIAPSSTLRFATAYSGEAINGSFASFHGDIQFSPDALDRSRVNITVDTASISSGDSQRDGTLKSPAWFSVRNFANATFTANRFRKTGSGYVANGSLTIKGVSAPISVPFTFTITGDRAVMRGSAQVDRTAYGLGAGEFAQTDEIPANVRVDIQVNAVRQK